MTPRERFLRVINFEKPDDRLPMIEWAAWWDKTLERWEREGMEKDTSYLRLQESFGLDPMACLYAPATYGGTLIHDERSYEEFRQYLFQDQVVENLKNAAISLKERHEKGEIIVRLWLDGFFWFPRALFGIEGHFYAFYDYPELMRKMNSELADFNIRIIEELFPILEPDMVGFGEDMSYNHGPMLSYELFKEFLAPYYHRVIPCIKKHGVRILMDSDGDVTAMVPWLREAGIEGVYPLERQANVDINKIRHDFPDFLMMGGYDKMVMNQGEEAMRMEFERILPVMKSGGYIPSVDHQTPPGVSLENYRIYLRLFRGYCEKAVE